MCLWSGKFRNSAEFWTEQECRCEKKSKRCDEWSRKEIQLTATGESAKRVQMSGHGAEKKSFRRTVRGTVPRTSATRRGQSGRILIRNPAEDRNGILRRILRRRKAVCKLEFG